VFSFGLFDPFLAKDIKDFAILLEKVLLKMD
jgi:hypothetical protein